VPYGGESYISSLDAKGLESLRAVTTADGHDDYRLEAPFEPSVEHMSRHEEVLVFEPIEAVAHDDESLTVAITVILCNCACACLTGESRSGMG
jgi:hypothetical protein